jgi:hypothetical protein
VKSDATYTDREGDLYHGGCQEFFFGERERKPENKLTNLILFNFIEW